MDVSMGQHQHRVRRKPATTSQRKHAVISPAHRTRPSAAKAQGNPQESHGMRYQRKIKEVAHALTSSNRLFYQNYLAPLFLDIVQQTYRASTLDLFNQQAYKKIEQRLDAIINLIGKHKVTTSSKLDWELLFSIEKLQRIAFQHLTNQLRTQLAVAQPTDSTHLLAEKLVTYYERFFNSTCNVNNIEKKADSLKELLQITLYLQICIKKIQVTNDPIKNLTICQTTLFTHLMAEIEHLMAKQSTVASEALGLYITRMRAAFRKNQGPKDELLSNIISLYEKIHETENKTMATTVLIREKTQAIKGLLQACPSDIQMLGRKVLQTVQTVCLKENSSVVQSQLDVSLAALNDIPNKNHEITLDSLQSALFNIAINDIKRILPTYDRKIYSLGKVLVELIQRTSECEAASLSKPELLSIAQTVLNLLTQKNSADTIQQDLFDKIRHYQDKLFVNEATQFNHFLASHPDINKKQRGTACLAAIKSEFYEANYHHKNKQYFLLLDLNRLHREPQNHQLLQKITCTVKASFWQRCGKFILSYLESFMQLLRTDWVLSSEPNIILSTQASPVTPARTNAAVQDFVRLFAKNLHVPVQTAQTNSATINNQSKILPEANPPASSAVSAAEIKLTNVLDLIIKYKSFFSAPFIDEDRFAQWVLAHPQYKQLKKLSDAMLKELPMRGQDERAGLPKLVVWADMLERLNPEEFKGKSSLISNPRPMKNFLSVHPKVVDAIHQYATADLLQTWLDSPDMGSASKLRLT